VKSTRTVSIFAKQALVASLISVGVGLSAAALAQSSTSAQNPTPAQNPTGAQNPTAPQNPTADQLENLRSTIVNLIRALVDQKLLTREKAQELLKQSGLDPGLLAAPEAQAEAGAQGAPAPPVIRVPYVPETVKREIREELRQEIVAQARAERWGEAGALPEWLSRISLHGDVRARYERDNFADSNFLNPFCQTPSDPALCKITSLVQLDKAFQLPPGTTKNDSEPRDRYRVRARLGVDAKVSEQFTAGARIATSSGGDANKPVSENVDLGQYDRRLGIALDLAYVRWNAMPTASLSVGRIENPYFSTDLIWAPDLTFDGAAVRWEPRLSDALSAFLTAGAHPIQLTQSSPLSLSGNQWLYAVQGGLGWTAFDESSARVGVTYYDYDNLAGRLNPALPSQNTLYAASVPVFRQFGNTMFNINAASDPNGTPSYAYASQFRLLDAVGQVELAAYDPLRVTISADYVRNLGFDARQIASRIGPTNIQKLPVGLNGGTGLSRERTTGYRFEGRVGNVRFERLADWQVYGGYRYLGGDAVPDAFVSEDYRLGGTDQRAHFAGVNFGLARNTWIGLRYTGAKTVDAYPYAVDTYYVDFNARF
jgi:hypothetical protein